MKYQKFKNFLVEAHYIMTLDEITKSFGELFKQYLTNPIFRQNIEFLTRVPIQEKDIQNVLKILQMVEDKYYYELEPYEVPWKPEILDIMSSIDLLIANPNKSFCRLGDGECHLMMGMNIGFQEYNADLAERLLKILSDESSNCYVGIPRYYWYIKDDIYRYNNERLKRWYTFDVPKYRNFFTEHCNKSKTYMDACIGVYMSHKSLDDCENHFKKLKTLFKDKKVVIVAGETVFNNIKYDFFSETAHKEIIKAPRINAYRLFDQIMEKLLTYSKDHIFVFILGPTATVAVYELSKHGYTAYDIGHVVKDYDAFMKRADRSSEAIAKFYAPD